MGAQNNESEQILQEINASLCSGAKPVLEDHWSRLVRGLRRSGRAPESAADAIIELLSVSGGPMAPGSRVPLLYQDYQRLSTGDRDIVDKRYLECLQAAKKDFPHVFQVQVINAPTSPADFLRAESTSSSELPRLNADQQSLAKALGIPQSEYARGELAKRYSEDRYRFYAERCWDFLVEGATRYSIDAVGVVYDVFSGKFYCEIRSDGRVRRFVLNAQIVWRPLEAGDKPGLDRAREAIRFAIEQALAPRGELVGVKQ